MMGTWLVVRSVQDLDTACRQANHLFARLWRQGGAPGASELLGVWVDQALALQPPSHLAGVDGSGQHRSWRIPESTGLAGIWVLCWIEAREPARTIDRCAIVDALLDSAPRPRAPRQLNTFIPVYSTAAPAADCRADFERLSAAEGFRLLPPWFQDPASGRCFGPCGEEQPRTYPMH